MMLSEIVEQAFKNDGKADTSTKVKTPFARITIGGTLKKPCYSIMWWDEANKVFNIGYSSYCLDNVRMWLKENFEIILEGCNE